MEQINICQLIIIEFIFGKCFVLTYKLHIAFILMKCHPAQRYCHSGRIFSHLTKFLNKTRQFWHIILSWVQFQCWLITLNIRIPSYCVHQLFCKRYSSRKTYSTPFPSAFRYHSVFKWTMMYRWLIVLSPSSTHRSELTRWCITVNIYIHQRFGTPGWIRPLAFWEYIRWWGFSWKGCATVWALYRLWSYFL